MTPTEQRNTSRLYRNAVARGDRSAGQHLAELVDSVQGLVATIVREHHDARRTEWEDLVSEANLAVVRAAQLYDPDGAADFASYTSGAIRKAVRASTAQMMERRVPTSWAFVSRMAHVVEPELEHQLGRRPSSVELQDELRRRAYRWAEGRLSADEMEELAARQHELTTAHLRKLGTLGAIDRLTEVRAAVSPMLRLDAEAFRVADSTVAVIDLRAGAGDPADVVAEADVHRRLRSVIRRLKPGLTCRQAAVLDNMVAEEPQSAKELAAEQGCTRQALEEARRQVLARFLHPLMLTQVLRATSDFANVRTVVP